jgi:hypothetical protein
MGMTHSSSGKRGFELYHDPKGLKIPRSEMIQILKLEEQYRFAQEVLLKRCSAFSFCWRPLKNCIPSGTSILAVKSVFIQY